MEEYHLRRGVRGEIMFLKAEMESMQTALLKVSEAPINQPPDLQVKLWAKAVRDLSYDLEDNIDKFMVQTQGPEKSQSFREFIDKSLSLLTKGKIRHTIGVNIKSRIKEVSERGDSYKVDSVAAARPISPTVDTHSTSVVECSRIRVSLHEVPFGSLLPAPPSIHCSPPLYNGMRLQDLKDITDNFSDERILGQGGFGVVYKGGLRNGQTIAVKRIMSSLMPDLQNKFESEMDHLMMLKHPNIVRCVGYCYETRYERLCYNGKYVFAEMAERLLCLEYMPMGSLDKYLSGYFSVPYSF